MIVLRNRLHAVVSNRRMYRMMLTCGIDEMTARNPGQLLDIDMQDARRRCRRCPAPETCDRWLNGEAVPGNDFCPNAALFMAAAEARRCRVTTMWRGDRVDALIVDRDPPVYRQRPRV